MCLYEVPIIPCTTHHPGSKEVPTPRACGRSFHEDMVGNGHVGRDAIFQRRVSANQQKGIVDIREYELDHNGCQEHGHPRPFVIIKHLEAEHSICRDRRKHIVTDGGGESLQLQTWRNT